MSNTIERTADMLMDQLSRLNALAVKKGEDMAESLDALKAECDRAKAVNDTARNIGMLADLHLRAEMMQMTPDRAFQAGAMFAEKVDAGKVDAGKARAQLKAATAWGGGSTTVINSHGEFETDDGLDDYHAKVEDNDARASNREPDGEHPTKCRSDDPDDVRRYAAERKRKSRAKQKAEREAAIEANKAQRDEWREMRNGE